MVRAPNWLPPSFKMLWSAYLRFLNFSLNRGIRVDVTTRGSLAHRLRALREEHWPGMKITQLQFAEALVTENL